MADELIVKLATHDPLQAWCRGTRLAFTRGMCRELYF